MIKFQTKFWFGLLLKKIRHVHLSKVVIITTGVITKMPMKDVLLSMQLISQETLVVSPAYYTTMQCKGWCASKYLHSYPDNFPGCRPSKYSNGSVLLKIEATQNSTQEMYPHFREHHFVNWNVSDCGCV